ncbi:hypothetical protein [Plasmodium yoelii yoelii]|uniref:Uncharacterized protein n=1 Tax=Plasmodium yoelii yoelii TaxID=73239 RepID=Q7RB68_PLAYO|nr:hypothetical protein [Plasmodium yoelii yoelii]
MHKTSFIDNVVLSNLDIPWIYILWIPIIYW